MMYVYVDGKYVYDNASSPQGLLPWIEYYQDLARKGHKVEIVIKYDFSNTEG